LTKDIVNHILNTMDFESLKAGAIKKILRNTAPVSQMEQLQWFVLVTSWMGEDEE
jgi:hypothetical protein